MNTQSLQDKFPEVYRDFYARNDLVVSWCFKFPWGYEWISDNFQWYLKIKSTIPLKCYVWIKFRKDLNINIWNVNFFNIISKNFEILNYNDISKWEYDKIIKLLLEEVDKLSIKKWFDIEFLSETTRWHSFWFSGTSSSILSYWIYKIYDYLNNKNIDNNFLNIYLEDIFSLSRKMDYILRFWATLWHNWLFTLLNFNWISYFISEEVINENVNIDNIDLIKYDYKYINNPSNIELPFDYFIIFSWLPTDTKQVENFKKLEYKNDIFNFLDKKLFKNNNYLDNLLNTNKFDYIKSNLLNIDTIKTLDFFHKIYSRPYDQNIINDFIEHINNRRWLISFIEKQSSFAEDFTYFFKKNQYNFEEKLWISPAYSWKMGWWYIVLTNFWLSRNTILKTIKDLKLIYPNIEIEYSSYIDWTNSDEIKVEQFISKWIYSKYIDKNKFIYQDNKWLNYLWDYSDIFEQNKWLILDMINGKIYFDWIKLTSKDIPSQNTTIEVISKLLSNIWVEVSNKEFSSSSYTWNKNEMLWKIILPLLKFIELKTWEKLQIVCKWSITDFFIKMWDVNLKIWTIKKI